jgi:hypothetical protein
LALGPAVMQLRNPPILKADARSEIVVRLLEMADRTLEEVAPQVDALRNQKMALNKRKDEWDGRFVELDQALQELHRLNNGWFARWRNKEQVQRARENVRRALIACREIALYHPSLVGLDDHPLLRG